VYDGDLAVKKISSNGSKEHTEILPKPKAKSLKFPVVGIGASAGGLETFTQLLNELPRNTGMAFVLIQHLDPTHPSLLTKALGRATKMPVQEIKKGMILKPNHVYVNPPGSDVGIQNGVAHLYDASLTSVKPHLAIDFFFRSLATDCGSQAIGVVLSGTGHDGTEGLRAIKAGDGITFAQDPASAKFSGMPESAVNSEVADSFLTIPKLSQELARLAHHPYVAKQKADEPLASENFQDLMSVFVLLKKVTGVDFSEYKPPTIKRRLARRMALVKIEGLQNYLKFLEVNPDEIKTLSSDLLIHVTSFFRDPEVFTKLQTIVFPEIIKAKSLDKTIRIWVTGCSTGEEVYSVAISLLEFLGEQSPKFTVQMFGSDLSERVIEKARNGFYTENVVRDLDPKRLKRFFVKVEGGYRINKLIRDLCVFVRHDLAQDPPFSRLDLITCRNVLIYFDQKLQKRIVSTFHYCLNKPGFLLLGHTENISGNHSLFSVTDIIDKIFSRSDTTSQLRFVNSQNLLAERQTIQPTGIATGPGRTNVDGSKQIDNFLLSQYAPAGVVINGRMEVLQYRGRTGIYLEAPPGLPQLNLLKMVREGLFAPTKMAITQAMEKMTIIRKEGLQFKQNGIPQICNLVVNPVSQVLDSKDPLFLVLFEEVPSQPKLKKGGAKLSLTKQGKLKEKIELQRTSKLEHELRTTQDYLQTLNEEHRKTNDALNSVNEDFVSGNEELQSMNEELETAKEELQSTNEELTTVNDELQNRNQETAQINDDLINVLNSVEIPILILDLDRRIRRFTPKARKILNLLPTDVGREIDDIKLNVNIKNIDEQVREVIKTDITRESEVQDREGKWHILQIRPYKTTGNKTNGAVLSLINIDILRRAVIDAEWVRDYSANIVEAVQIPLLALNDQIKVISANQAFYDTFKVSKGDTEGKILYELGRGQWNIDSLKKSLGEMLEKKSSFLNTEVVCELPTTGSREMSLSARPIKSHDGIAMILLAIEDITDRKNREKERRELLNETAQINDDLFNLLNSVEIPILILDLDRRIRRFTSNARVIMNLLPTDVGRKVDEIKPNVNIENLDQKIQKVIQSATDSESEVQDREGKWYRLQIRPYRTSDNKIAGTVLALINIDMLRRAVIDAEWVRDNSASIVEAVQIPLLALDEKIRVISANQAFYEAFNVSKEETEEKSLYELGSGQWNIASLKKSLGEMLEKKSSFLNAEVVCELPTTGLREMSLSARPIKSHDGIAMILLAIEDITDRKNSEKERQELLHQTQEAKADADKANLTKDLFLATLSHELRTPLTSLLLHAQMLQHGTIDEAKVKRASRAIERAAQTQTKLIEDLLDVSRIVSGNLKMELTPVNISEIITTSLDTVSGMAESKSITIESNLDDFIELVSGDAIRLQQVVWNVLVNAIKFTPRGGKVIVTLNAIDGKAQIQVTDTGIGIMPAFLPHVFQRFSQAEGTITRVHGGLGLGLAIVRHLIEMHGGTVKVESPGQDQGSTFTVLIPLIKTAFKKSSPLESKSVSSIADFQKILPVRLDGIRILIVEDDLGAREALTEALTQAGAEVRAAGSAAEAILVLKEFAPEQFLFDIAMPGEDGYSLLRRIRKLQPVGGKTIPAIAFTALASDKDRQEAFSAGFQMHLVKPIDIGRLTGALLELSDAYRNTV